jgi:hypothetical protein
MRGTGVLSSDLDEEEDYSSIDERDPKMEIKNGTAKLPIGVRG